MKPKIKDILSKTKIALALGKLVFTGQSKTIEKVEKGVEIVEAVKDLLKSSKSK